MTINGVNDTGELLAFLHAPVSQTLSVVAVVMIWRTVWRLLDLIMPMRFDVDGQRKRAFVEAIASVTVGLFFLVAVGGLPREW